MGEVPSNVDGIATALLAYEAAFDDFVAADFHPVPIQELDHGSATWSQGSSFDTIGWAPDGRIYGTYRITLTDGGRDFLVEGLTRRGRTPEGKVSYYHRTRASEVHSEYLDWPITEADLQRAASGESKGGRFDWLPW